MPTIPVEELDGKTDYDAETLAPVTTTVVHESQIPDSIESWQAYECYHDSSYDWDLCLLADDGRHLLCKVHASYGDGGEGNAYLKLAWTTSYELCDDRGERIIAARRPEKNPPKFTATLDRIVGAAIEDAMADQFDGPDHFAIRGDLADKQASR